MGLLSIRIQAFSQYRSTITHGMTTGDIWTAIRALIAKNAMLPQKYRSDFEKLPTENEYGYERKQALWEWFDKHLKLNEGENHITLTMC